MYLPIDIPALLTWMDAHGLGEGSITDAQQLAGGTQNILIRFRRSGREFILRHPPLHKRTNSDETMRREARVLEALRGTDVPHPELIAAEPSPEALGSAFYLMAPVDGFNVRLELADACRDDPDWQHRLGMSMVEALTAVSAVDVDAAGLADLGNATNWAERQVAKWRRQYDGYRGVDNYDAPPIDGLDAVTSWLQTHEPTTPRVGLLHGDFHFGNVIVANDGPRIAAIVDWELATVGDPMLDLGHMLATWPGATPTSEPLGGTGLPTANELVERYCALTGRGVIDTLWFRVLACYRLGLILEGTYARACAGHATAEVGERMYAYTRNLFALALTLLEDS